MWVELRLGMKDYDEIITAYNFGEKKAKLSYTILELTVLGKTYVVEDGKVTLEDLSQITVQQLLDSYPFKISVDIENEELEEGNGVSGITISLKWPFEQGDDELDTFWGEEAAKYYKQRKIELEQLNSDEKIVSISIKIELKATQILES